MSKGQNIGLPGIALAKVAQLIELRTAALNSTLARSAEVAAGTERFSRAMANVDKVGQAMANINRVGRAMDQTMQQNQGALNAALARSAEVAAGIERLSRAMANVDNVGRAMVHMMQRNQAVIDSVSPWTRVPDTRISASLALELRDQHNQSATWPTRLSHSHAAIQSEKPRPARATSLVNNKCYPYIKSESFEAELQRNVEAANTQSSAIPTASSPSTIPEISVTRAFELRVLSVSVPQPISSVDRKVSFDPKCRELMTELEQWLRKAIEDNLSRLDGQRWIKRRVPEEIRKRWFERKENDVKTRRPVFSMVQYSDFMDLADIICRSDNWHDVFETIFHNRNDLRVSFDRLHPIRKAIAHNRPISQSDVLTVMNEANQLLSAMGIRIRT